MSSFKKVILSPPEICIQREIGLELMYEFMNERKEDYELLSRLFSADEETLFFLSLIFLHVDRTNEVIGQIRKYKPHVRNPEELHNKLMKQLAAIDLDRKDREKEAEVEIARWKKKITEVRQRIKRIVSYFRPTIETTRIEKVILVPSDQMIPKNSGRSFRIGGEILIMSHSENLDNVEHEFLHGLINPIVFEKLQLSDQQRNRIVELAGRKLKEEYGEYPLSLLSEELIRTFNDLVKHGKRPESLKQFKRKLQLLDEKEFRKAIRSNKVLKSRLRAMDISSLNELCSRVEEYYNRYGKDQLRERIYDLYLGYEAVKEKGIIFEEFLKDNITEFI